MRASTSLLVILGMVVICGGIPCVAQTIEETILQLQSVAINDDVPDGICNAGGALLGVPGQTGPDYYVARLNAEVWATQTRARDSQVVNSTVRRVGTAQACGWIPWNLLVDYGYEIIDLTQPLPQSPFYIEFQIGDLFLRGAGATTATSGTIPEQGLVLTTCSMRILPDASQGLLGGSASSSTIFDLAPQLGRNLPTGSFWTLRIYRQLE